VFAAETYLARRQELQRRLGSGLVLFLGNGESPMNYADNTYPFRQDSTFLYYFGLDQPDLAAVMDLEADRDVVFGDELTIDDIVWQGDLPTIAARAERAGVTHTQPLTHLDAALAQARTAGRRVHFLPPYRPENKLKLQHLLGLGAEQVPQQASRELIQAVVDMRSIKSAEEITQLEEAVEISVQMHLAAMRMARPGMREAEIAAEVHRVALAAGGRPSFPIIATVHGETLHNHHHGNTLRAGDLFLLDAGAENAMHYAGDLSSTFPADTRFTARQRTIYEISLAAHEAAVASLAPGVPNRAVHFAAARVIAEGMRDLGLMRGNLDDALQEGAHALFFPCGVGHMLGLDVHDMEDLGEQFVGYEGRPKSSQFGLKSLRLARPLQPGFTITIEPGIYFIPQLIDWWRSREHLTEFVAYDQVDRWRDFGGLRNEENYLITADGKRRLGPPKPMTRQEVEAIRAG
jgi:Xaa-Pro aminopeptidase